MNGLLILNEAAGSMNGERDAVTAPDLIEALRAQGILVTPRNAPPRQLCRTLQSAVNERPEAIFVGGGDGSISAAAGCLAGSNVALGVLPLGTLNHFARDLGLPLDWTKAVAALGRGQVRGVDVGEVNGNVFINNCSLGSYPEAVRKRDALRHTHGSGKWWAMFVATFAVFCRLRRMRLQIEIDGKRVGLRTPFVFIGNNAYSGRVFAHSLRPRLDEGRLWLYTTHAHRRLEVLHLAWQTLVRRIDAADALETHSVQAATIVSENGRDLPIAADGELLDLKPPLHFKVRPGALRVIVPAEKAHE
jgi:diacylglycerol kinase family enzyme